MTNMMMIRGLNSAIKNTTLHETITRDKLLQPNNYFEVISDKYELRPFVDLDGSFTKEISEDEFNHIDTEIINKLKTLENVSILTSSNYKALKITVLPGKAPKKEILIKLSYRLVWTNERVKNISTMKTIIKESKFPLLEDLLASTIEVTAKSDDNKMNVDFSVYRNGDGKMRCVNAYKHHEQPERINKLVKGEIEDTFININQHELDKYVLIEPQSDYERKKKQEEKDNKMKEKEKEREIKMKEKELHKNAKNEEKEKQKEEKEEKKNEKQEEKEKEKEEKKYKKQKEREEKSIEKTIEKEKAKRDFTEPQIIELMSIIGNSADWDRWNTYGLVLHDNWYSFEVFNNWSKMHKKHDGQITKRQWDTQYPASMGKWSIYTLLKDAKINNPEKYKAWCKKCKQPHILSILKQGAEMFDEEYKQDLFQILKYSKGDWYYCNKENLWIELSTPEKAILTFIRGHMEDCEDMMKAFEVGGFLALLKKNFETSLNDDEFHRKLCTPVDYIAFKNGLYNLKTKVFQKGFKAENYVSKTLSYDFDKNFKSISHVKTQIVEEFTKLFCNEPELMEYVFCILGFALTGRASEMQQFYSFIGQIAGNGKSTLFIILSKILDIYIKQTSPKCFEADYSKAHKDLANLQGIRFLVSEEFRKGAVLNEQLTKRFRDGLPLENEILFGTCKTIDLQCKLFFTSNATLKFEADGGMSRSYREINLRSRFVENYETSEFKHEPLCFQADKNFPDKFLQPEYRDELIHMLFEYSNKYYTDGLITPAFINEDSKQTCEMQGDQFKTFFEDNYVIDPEGYVLKEDINLSYFQTYKKNIDLVTLKDEFKKISYSIIYDKNKKGKGDKAEKRGGFRGIREILDIPKTEVSESESI